MKKKNLFLTLFIIYIIANYLFFLNKIDGSNIKNIIYTFVFIILSTIIFLLFRYIKKIYSSKGINIKPEKVFLVLAIILGAIYLCVTPLFKGHDEQYHWYKAYSISIGNLVSEKTDDGKVGDTLPRYVDRIKTVQGSFQNITYATSIKAIGYSTILSQNENETKDIFIENTTTSLYPFVQMLPQMSGIIIARSMGASIYFQAIAGRITNLAFFILLGYLAIKILPSKKYFLMAFLLCPKVMYISATLSGDVFTNSIIILFIAYILKLMSDKKNLSKKDILILSVLIPCVAISKIVYLPICLLVLILPKECFKNTKSRILQTLWFILIAMVLSVISLKTSSDLLSITSPDSSKQVEYILNNPFNYLYTALDNTARNIIEWVLDIVGGYMEWGSILTQPAVISIFVYCVLIVSTFLKQERIKLTKLQRIFIILIILAVCGLIETALYVQWTPQFEGIGGKSIVGIQGRYFTPIVLLIPLTLGGILLKIQKKIPSIYEKTIVYGIIIWQLPTILNILTRNM